MRTYTVREGDTPASIAARDEMAGCPKCAVDLIRANPHKETVTHPNGFKTFKDLREGEKLRLPEKWFNGDLDSRPKAYFAALPYMDGVTPSTLGDAAAGVLNDYSALDAASAAIGYLAVLNDREFNDAVAGAVGNLEAAVQEVGIDPAASTYAQSMKNAVDTAVALTANLNSAIAAGDQTGGAEIRRQILGALSDAIVNARLALNTYYGGANTAPTPPAPPASTAPVGFPADLIAAAQAVLAATTNTYCTSVSRAGTPFNSAVHAFKVAWNASQTPQIPVNTGAYEQATADALARIVGQAPAACPPRVVPSTPPVTPPSTLPSAPVPVAVTAPEQKSGISTGGVIGIGLVAATAVGGALYLASKSSTGRGRRSKRRRSFYYQ